MSEETVVRQAAPTLAGIKTGSMFPYRFTSHAELIEDAFIRRSSADAIC